jgi:hypothetical protein
MFPSRKIIAAFVGVFIMGAAVGALLITTFQDGRLTKFLASTGDPKSMAARINAKYAKEENLTPEELARIAPLTEEMTQHLYEQRRQFGIDIISTLKEYHEKIGDQMTPEHRQAFQLANQERERRMSALLLLDDASAGQK